MTLGFDFYRVYILGKSVENIHQLLALDLHEPRKKKLEFLCFFEIIIIINYYYF